mgnify:CR=1 FL=1
MNNNNVACIDCSHYAVCRFKDNMNDVRENINKMKNNDKNKNLNITVDCVYYVDSGAALRAKAGNEHKRLNVTIPEQDFRNYVMPCTDSKVGNGEPGV